MGKNITTSPVEPAHEWLNKLAKEAPKDRLFPAEYDFEEVRGLAIRVGEETLERKNDLYFETALSEREADVASLKEAGLTHAGIALALSVEKKSPDENVRKSTVDEYARRAREKYREAVKTSEKLRPVFDERGEIDE